MRPKEDNDRQFAATSDVNTLRSIVVACKEELAERTSPIWSFVFQRIFVTTQVISG
jgi:hypothetical protein